MLPHRMNEWIEIILHNDVCKQSEQVMRFFGKTKIDSNERATERIDGWASECTHTHTLLHHNSPQNNNKSEIKMVRSIRI